MPGPLQRFRAPRGGARRPLSLAAAVIGGMLVAADASASIMTFLDAGVSVRGTPLAVAATIATAADAGGPADTLEITLRSYGAPTRYAADVLASFYFDLVDPITGVRPVLTYLSGTGQAFEVHDDAANDTPVSWTPQIWSAGSTAPSNLVATKPGDEGWQFKAFAPPPTAHVPGFGIGTVGNSNIAQLLPGFNGGFDGRIVSGRDPGSMINLGIYSVGGGSDIDPAGVLDGARLVRSKAVFRFRADRALDGVDPGWVKNDVAFGFGTGPETLLLPEPGALPLAATGIALGWLARCRLRRARVPLDDPRSGPC